MNRQPTSKGSKKDTKELAIFGAYPPPFGGVTMHLKRLKDLLRELCIPFRIFNLNNDSSEPPDIISARKRRLRTVCSVVLGHDYRTIYLVNRQLVLWGLIALLGCVRRKRVVIRLQRSDVLDWRQKSRWKWWCAAFIFRISSGVVCVNRELATEVASMGVLSARIFIRPGFLPPNAAELDQSLLPGQASDFVASHSPLIAANGRVAWYQDQDLYGLDLLVELCGELKKQFPNIGLFVSFWGYDPVDQPYLDKLQSRISQLGIEGNCFLCRETALFLPVLKQARLFIRPTNTDGDANSIREALFLGKIAIASNCVARPENTILFENRDLADLVRVASAALNDTRPTDSSAGKLLALSPRESVKDYLEFVLGRPVKV